MLNWTPSDPASCYQACAKQLGHCYCEYKGLGPCYSPPKDETEMMARYERAIHRDNQRAAVALGLALAGILLWPLGLAAVIAARPSKCARAPWAYGLGIAECLWCFYVLTVIAVSHAR
jgi:hypothetical protein